MKKQIKISKWLKGLCVILAVLGVVFFAALSFVKYKATDAYGMYDIKILLAFTFVIAFLCYAVLYEFWKVCGEIGKDNSFSLENARSFHMMAIYGGIALGSYVLRIIYFFAAGVENFIPIAFAIACIALCIVFIIAAEALSQLIRNAYDMKVENDLTI